MVDNDGIKMTLNDGDTRFNDALRIIVTISKLVYSVVLFESMITLKALFEIISLEELRQCGEVASHLM